jgi:hypothetical protein
VTSFATWVDIATVVLVVAGMLILLWDNVKIRRVNKYQREIIRDLRSKLAKYYLEDRLHRYEEEHDGSAR